MIDHESEVFEIVSKKLRETYDDIYITQRTSENIPLQFPCVYITQKGTSVNTMFSTFNQRENVAIENYQFEVFSNLSIGREKQTKEIVSHINDVMDLLGYYRSFNESISNSDSSISRRIVRFTKNNSI